MAGEKRKGRGDVPGYIVIEDSCFTKGGMFTPKDQKRAITELNRLHDDARGLLGAGLSALQGIQLIVKAKEPGLDVEQALSLARHITADTQTFKERLDQIKAKIPEALTDEAVLSSLHIATELQQWTEDWGNIASPMIASVNTLLEKKDV